jgi:hypothetical protein
MTQQQILAFLSSQKSPLTDRQITTQNRLNILDAADCEGSLLTMLYAGWLCEPNGEFNGWLITDAGLEELKRLSNVKPEKKQAALF